MTVFVLLLIPVVDPLGWSPINAALGLCMWAGFRQIHQRGTVAPAAPLSVQS